MKKKGVPWFTVLICIMFLAVLGMSTSASVFAQALPGYAQSVEHSQVRDAPGHPPVMPKAYLRPPPQRTMILAVRQFKQQHPAGGLWDVLSGRTDNFPPTTIWSYGRAADPAPDITGLGGRLRHFRPASRLRRYSTFNYPAFTVENMTMVPAFGALDQ